MKSRPLPSIDVFKAEFNYDPLIGKFTYKKYKIGSRGLGGSAGYTDSDGRLRLTVNGSEYFAHRVAFLWAHGHCPDVIDHKDRNCANNAISNLREASQLQNIWNSCGHSTKLSGLPKGIRKNKRGGKFNARIRINGKAINLGSFASVEEAVEIRNRVALETHGEFYCEG